MSTGTMSIAIMAILTGLVGAYVFRTVLMEDQLPGKRSPTRMTVPLANIDLPAGRTVSFGDIVMMPMSSAEMKEQNMPISLVMMEPSQIIGRTLRTSIEQGRPFLTTGMYLDGTKPDVAELLKPGFRAVHLQIPDSRGGNVRAGSTVDVLFRAEPDKVGDGSWKFPETTLTLLEGAEVLLVETPKASARRDSFDVRYRNTGGPPPKSPTVVLAVTPRQASVLQTVEGRGQLSLVTRAQGETLITSGQSQRVTLESLLGLAPPPEPEQPFSTEIYRRGDRQQLDFDRSSFIPDQQKRKQAAIAPLYPPVRSTYRPSNTGITAGLLDTTQDKVTRP
ncbi:MAG: Flp pilus assembly protein CpaB [Planctomycetales bacterium]|nr:Flp pilus assembly protein CpaB [Planctomycetales bacterium]